MSSLRPGKKIHQWLDEPLGAEVKRALDRLSNATGVCHIAVMPDVHLSREVCIGTVVATEDQYYPQAVGNDIGCGMTAIGFDCDAHHFMNERNAARILEELSQRIPTIRHSRKTMQDQLPSNLMQFTLSHEKLEKAKSKNGRAQLGTLGSGNHFLEFQADEQGALWVMVHSGSRGMGQLINDHHLPLAIKSKWGLKFFESTSKTGKAYFNDVEWACLYAESNRSAMMEEVRAMMQELFGVSAWESSIISCNHNHVCREMHYGKNILVHRKGALSAKEGEPGIIPGSMGAPSFHTEGRGHPAALNSSSHGAGRVMSRGEARKKITLRHLHQQMEGVWFNHNLGHQLRDEAPAAYKNISVVMRAQKGLTRIVRKLQPLLSYKGV